MKHLDETFARELEELRTKVQDILGPKFGPELDTLTADLRNDIKELYKDPPFSLQRSPVVKNSGGGGR